MQTPTKQGMAERSREAASQERRLLQSISDSGFQMIALYERWLELSWANIRLSAAPYLPDILSRHDLQRRIDDLSRRLLEAAQQAAGARQGQQELLGHASREFRGPPAGSRSHPAHPRGDPPDDDPLHGFFFESFD